MDQPIKALSMHIQKPYKGIIVLSSHGCDFVKKNFFFNQTPSCICSICLYCISKISNSSIKSCGRSCFNPWRGHLYIYKSRIREKLFKFSQLSFVKNYFFWLKLLHAYVQCVYIVSAKYQIAPSKAVVGVDRPIKAPSMHIQTPY